MAQTTLRGDDRMFSLGNVMPSYVGNLTSVDDKTGA